MRTGGRPVAVLGDMRELGPEERSYHRQTGEYAAAAGVKLLWGVGPLSTSTAEGFGAVCAPDSSAEHVASPEDVFTVASSLRQGDVVLFKASRGIRLEVMVAAISEEARSGRWAPGTGEPTSRTHSRESGSGE